LDAAIRILTLFVALHFLHLSNPQRWFEGVIAIFFGYAGLCLLLTRS